MKWVWCKDCGGGSICKIGWAHKNRAHHDVCSLKDAGKVDVAMKEFLFVHRGGKAAQEALIKEKSQKEAGQTRTGAPQADVYKLAFGKFKGQTIASMYTASVADCRKFNATSDSMIDYIPWLWASANPNMLNGHMLALRLALQREGSWDRTLERARAMRPG